MKHYRIPTTNVMSVMALLCISFFVYACQQDVDTPSLSCPEMKMTTTIADRNSTMNLSNSLLFREQTDSGGLKFLSVETVSDSVKIVLNLTDGLYDELAMKNDSLHLKTYTFTRNGLQSGGRVAAALMGSNGEFSFLTTDSSSITIRKISPRAQTVSGSFYFINSTRMISGAGSFENVCYLSLQ